MGIVDVSDFVSANKRYYIYGTKSLGIFLYEKITALYGQECILGFLETKPIAQSCLGSIVCSPGEIKNLEKEDRIIIASATHFKEIKNTLDYCGFSKEQIIIPHKIFDYFKSLYGMKKDNVRKICFWPPINDYNQNLLKKIAWFIPDRIKVQVWCDDENLRSKFNPNVCFEELDNINCVFEESEIIFLWDTDSDEMEYEKYRAKMYVVDPNFYLYVETLNYSKLYYHSFSSFEKEEYKKKSKKIFSELKKVGEFSKTRIFCSGPSIDEIYENTYKDSINIICNSMVKDKEWLKRIQPHVLAFTDLNYYLSPTAYCKKFLKDVIESQNIYNYYIVVYDFEVPLLLSHCPELSGKVIGIANDSKTFEYLSSVQLRVRNTSNILTEIMIPLASSLCDEIEIAGCTGRSPDENFYWKHNGRTQYIDLMHTVFEMYPSLFRDQKYANYYEYHCQCVEEILKYGEERGKKYSSLTTSYIPALKKRMLRKLK